MGLTDRLLRLVKANINVLFPKEDAIPGRPFEPPPSDSSFEAGFDPPQEPQKDPELAKYYANLEIAYGSDWQTVRKAYKSLVKKYHPDLYSNDSERRELARQITQGLNQAHAELKKRLKP